MCAAIPPIARGKICSVTTFWRDLQDVTRDTNDDGKADVIDIFLRMPLAPTEAVQHVWLIALFDYKLEVCAFAFYRREAPSYKCRFAA